MLCLIICGTLLEVKFVPVTFTLLQLKQCIVELPKANVFIIGVHAGPCKPESVKDYMRECIDNLKVRRVGATFNGKHYIEPHL